MVGWDVGGDGIDELLRLHDGSVELTAKSVDGPVRQRGGAGGFQFVVFAVSGGDPPTLRWSSVSGLRSTLCTLSSRF